MAFDRQTAPLEIAATVLKPETIREVRIRGFTNSAYLILDRWAMNSPDELKALEAKGQIAFDLKLYGQQQEEAHALNSDTAWEMSQRGMSDWEILEILRIDTELRTIE
jgi:hypothetical protein